MNRADKYIEEKSTEKAGLSTGTWDGWKAQKQHSFHIPPPNRGLVSHLSSLEKSGTAQDGCD